MGGGVGDGEGLGDGYDGGRAGGAEGHGDAVEEEGGGKGAEQEVLDGGLGCGGATFAEAGEDVGGDGRDLEADENHEELDRRGHEHHAGGTEEDEGEILAGVAVGGIEVIERGENGDDRDGGDEEVEVDGEGVDLDGSREGEDGAAAVGEQVQLVPGGGAGGEGRKSGKPAEGLAGCARGEHGLEQHDENAGEDEDVLGEESEGVVVHSAVFLVAASLRLTVVKAVLSSF